MDGILLNGDLLSLLRVSLRFKLLLGDRSLLAEINCRIFLLGRVSTFLQTTSIFSWTCSPYRVYWSLILKPVSSVCPMFWCPLFENLFTHRAFNCIRTVQLHYMFFLSLLQTEILCRQKSCKLASASLKLNSSC